MLHIQENLSCDACGIIQPASRFRMIEKYNDQGILMQRRSRICESCISKGGRLGVNQQEAELRRERLAKGQAQVDPNATQSLSEQQKIETIEAEKKEREAKKAEKEKEKKEKIDVTESDEQAAAPIVSKASSWEQQSKSKLASQLASTFLIREVVDGERKTAESGLSTKQNEAAAKTTATAETTKSNATGATQERTHNPQTIFTGQANAAANTTGTTATTTNAATATAPQTLDHHSAPVGQLNQSGTVATTRTNELITRGNLGFGWDASSLTQSTTNNAAQTQDNSAAKNLARQSSFAHSQTNNQTATQQATEPKAENKTTESLVKAAEWVRPTTPGRFR